MRHQLVLIPSRKDSPLSVAIGIVCFAAVFIVARSMRSAPPEWRQVDESPQRSRRTGRKIVLIVFLILLALVILSNLPR